VTDASIALQPAQQAARAEASLHASVGKLGNTMFETGEVALSMS